MKQYTKQEFFEKMEWEGDFDAMASYCGHVKITDDVDLNNAWHDFVNSFADLTDIYDDWYSAQPLEDHD